MYISYKTNNIGIPSSKIDSLINLDSSYLIFNKKDLNERPLINNFYFPNKSKSFNLAKKTNTQIISNHLIRAGDIFTFNNNEICKINFLLKNDNNINLLSYNFLPEIGLGFPKTDIKNNNQNLLLDLKKREIISENIITIKYNENYSYNEEGILLFGDDLLKYDSNYSMIYQ